MLLSIAQYLPTLAVKAVALLSLSLSLSLFFSAYMRVRNPSTIITCTCAFDVYGHTHKPVSQAVAVAAKLTQTHVCGNSSQLIHVYRECLSL